MFKSVLILFLAMSFLACKEKNAGKSTLENEVCQKYHEGTFEKHGPPFGSIKVVRTKDKQIESIGFNQLEVSFNIEWVDDCTYKLKFDTLLANPKSLNVEELLPTMEFECTIIKSTMNTHTVLKQSSRYPNQKGIEEVWKIVQ
jgi:hypothetical protein